MTLDLLAQDLIGAADIDLRLGRVRAMNQRLVRLLGYDHTDHLARQLVLLAGPERPAHRPASRDGLRGAGPPPEKNRVSGETPLKCHDGSFVRVRFTRIGPGVRHPAAASALLLIERAVDTPDRDPTAEQSYRDIYENVTDGIYRSSLDGRQLSANPALVRLNGYDSESEMLAGVSDIATEWYVDPNRRSEFQQLMQANGHVENFVSEIFRHRTRERIWISENARLVTDPVTGAPLHYEGTIRDVTETVRRLDLEQRLRAVIDTIADTIVIVDRQGRLESMNRAGEQMFGCTAAAVAGKSLRLLIDAPDHGNDPDLLALICEAGDKDLAVRNQRARGLRLDGTAFPMLVSVTSIADRGGRLFALTGRDITLQSAHEEGLRLARDAAEQANRMKSDFVSMVSHELRTPLNGVIGMAGLLLDGALDAQSRRHAETLSEAAEHLLQLINDLLDFSKLDRDLLEFEDVPFEIGSLAQGALELLSPRAQSRGLTLGMSVASDAPRVAVGDPGRLRQVLLNLLGNALKFTERGAVSLHVSLLDSDASGFLVGFEVRDTGIGIPPEGLKILFQEFTQVDRSISRRFGGTASGLQFAEGWSRAWAARLPPRAGWVKAAYFALA